MKKKIIALALAIIAVLSLAACGRPASTTEPEQTPKENVETTTTPETTQPTQPTESSEEPTPEEETPPEEEEPEPEETPIAIGDTAALGDWEIVVTNFEFKTEIKDNYGSFSPDEGNQYGVVYVTVTNSGKEAGRFLPFIGLDDDVSTKIMYGDGYEYSPTSLIGHDEDMHDKVLNPLTSASGIIAFALPQAVVDSTEPLVLSMSAGSNEVTFTLR